MPNNNLEIRPYFIIPSALITEGATQLLLFDTERSENYLLPLRYKRLIENKDELPLQEAAANYGYTQKEFDTVVEYLESKDLLYYSDMKDFYKPIEPKFDYPSKLSNVIIDIGEESKFDFFIASKLTEANCFHLQIRFFRDVYIEEIIELFDLLQNMFVMSIELAIYNGEKIIEEDLADVMSNYVFIEAAICYKSSSEKKSTITAPGQLLYFTKQELSIHSCGLVSTSYFTTSVPAFSESTKYNSCLNRKISIDQDGEIKNCPSMKESFGNIKDTSLLEALEKPGFKKYWGITKDKIHVCKDCEFRYICTDCRAYVEDPEDILSKPLKCGYNPYTGEWSEWSTNPLKQKAIDIYGMREMIKNESL